MIKKQLLLVCILILLINSNFLKAQTLINDTLKLMTYNVGNYGKPPGSGCPLLNLTFKNAYLRTILEYEQPDILGMVKMSSSQLFCTDTVVHSVLDSVCNGCWGHGTYSIVSTYAKENMLYFKTNKIGFVSSTVIYSGDQNISDITLHKLFYKSPNLASTHDTVFINVVLAHLLSGGGNTSNRDTEVAGAMTWLNAHVSNPENLIFMGDMNTTASTENCFTDLINSTNNNTKFYDPPNQLGQWTNNPTNFGFYLTQSTRTTDPGDCNATGGMSNRFDHILLTSPVVNGTLSLKYIPSSYTVIGQDGDHVGNALTDPPVNSSVPANENSALYYMSEHLPVSIKMVVSYLVSVRIENYLYQNIKINYTTLVTDNIIVSGTSAKGFDNDYSNCKAIVYDINGRIISETLINLIQTNTIKVSEISNGMYFLKIIKGDITLLNGKLIKVKE